MSWEDKMKTDFREQVGSCWLHSIGSGYIPEVDSWEQSNKLSGSIKVGNFFTISAALRFSRMILLYGVSYFFYLSY